MLRTLLCATGWWQGLELEPLTPIAALPNVSFLRAAPEQQVQLGWGCELAL